MNPGDILMLTDTPNLRNLLGALLPGLEIASTPRASGQRVVYFCKFNDALVGKTTPQHRAKWGDVVLKVSEGIDATQVAYLQKEIEILNSLNSPHYPRLHWHEIYTEDPRSGDTFPHRLFVTVEEKIDAPPLSAVMESYRTEEAVRNLISRLIEALTPLWLHPQKLVHRDIKPDNILVRKDGSVVVIDLGILREEGSIGVTNTHHPYGPCTPLYASPEQARNDKRNITFKSDFFSLGVLAYELLSGGHPFTHGATSLTDLLEQVQTVRPPKLSTKYRISQPFSSLIDKMMEKEPYKRHRTVNQLASELQGTQTQAIT